MKVTTFFYISIVFFISKGQVGFILPRYVTKVYKVITAGDYFGHLELSESSQLFDESSNTLNNSQANINPFVLSRKTTPIVHSNPAKGKLSRRFTAQALEQTEILTLSLADIQVMKTEFYDIFYELFDDVKSKLKKELLFKLEAIKRLEY